MILGKITGKIGTNEFTFKVESEPKKFEYVQVMHKEYGYVLAQIIDLERNKEDELARCMVIGYKDPEGKVRQIRTPFEHNTEVLIAQDDFIRQIVDTGAEKDSAYIGKLDGKDINVYLDLKKLLTKHVSVLAKSGGGKSYTVGVLIEEIMEKNVPLLIIDPHGEYGTLAEKNDERRDLDNMKRFGIEPKSYAHKVVVYGDSDVDKKVKPLRLNDKLEPAELMQILPGKITNTQQGLLYTAIGDKEKISFDELLAALNNDESNNKWALIAMIEQLTNLKLFSEHAPSYYELIQPGQCTILSFKGIDPEVQQIIVYKLLKDLFEERKQESLPPFFLVIEEAHNFAPERSFGEAKSSKILRTIASEGRKFGLGICVITQRPARLDKSVLSQCTTQIILKVTNPNDLKAVSNSVEGITEETEKEIPNLPIGTAIITGIVDNPIFVNIRPRKTKHGGKAVDMLKNMEEEIFDEITEFKKKELIPIIKPKITVAEIKLNSARPVHRVETRLVPAAMYLCQEKDVEFQLLIELLEGNVVTNAETFKTAMLPNLESLSQLELSALEKAFVMGKFSLQDLMTELKLSMGIMTNVIDTLNKNGFLVFDGTSYSTSDKVILSKLSDYSCYDKIQHMHVPFDKKMAQKIKPEAFRKKLEKFTTVKGFKDCYAVVYDVSYK